MAGIHRRRPGADAMAPATGDPAVDLGDGIWMSPGLSNSYLLTSDDGPIVVNTGMGFEGRLHRRAFDTADRSDPRVVVLTHGHYDHVGGLHAFVTADTEVVAQANYATWRADNERLEKFRTRNAAFAFMDRVLTGIERADALGLGGAPQSRPEPTTVVEQSATLEVGDRRLVLVSAPGGETTDSMVLWLPDIRTAFTGNLFGPLFGHVPNLVTIRGDRYRDALSYISSVEVVLGLGAERLITGHFDPIDGADLIAEEITALRDGMQWVHDRTLDGMNAGDDVHTLMREVRVPDHLDVGEGYGKTTWNVRAIWENYAGWFHHRSTTELYGVPDMAAASDIVGVAGTDALTAAARARLEAGEPVVALHVTDIVLAAEPDHGGARAVAAAATRRLREASSNFWESAWLDRSLEELEKP
jgi:alkyl sulfatase BDS1-like metallo-beta-lactamase superfamily hydrolase